MKCNRSHPTKKPNWVQLFSAMLGIGLGGYCVGMTTDPSRFDRDGNQFLDAKELRAYLAFRFPIDVSTTEILTVDLEAAPDGIERVRDRVRQNANDRARQVYAQLNQPADSPVALGRLMELESPRMPAIAKMEMPGLIAAARSVGKTNLIGPLLLRRSPDDWDSEIESAKGAKFGYSNNRKSGESAWDSKGALIYPIRFFTSNPGNRYQQIDDTLFQLLPSISWRVNQVNETDSDDIQELSAQLPVAYTVKHKFQSWLKQSEFVLKPYILTDFSLQGWVYGTTAEYGPMISKNWFRMNTGFQSFTRNPSNSRLLNSLKYQFRGRVILDYNHFASESIYVQRKDHDDRLHSGFSIGGGIESAMTSTASIQGSLLYQGLFEVSGSQRYSDSLEASLTIWFNQNVGFGLSYEQGETPTGQTTVDLLKAGLEMRF